MVFYIFKRWVNMFINKIQKIIKSRSMSREQKDESGMTLEDKQITTLEEVLSYFNLNNLDDWPIGYTNCLAFALGLNFSYERIKSVMFRYDVVDFIKHLP